MISWCWGLALTVAGIAGVWLVGGRFQKIGWALLFGGQGLWIAYVVLTEQWGFVPGVIGYAMIYARNFHRCPRLDPVKSDVYGSDCEVTQLDLSCAASTPLTLDPAVEPH